MMNEVRREVDTDFENRFHHRCSLILTIFVIHTSRVDVVKHISTEPGKAVHGPSSSLSAEREKQQSGIISDIP